MKNKLPWEWFEAHYGQHIPRDGYGELRIPVEKYLGAGKYFVISESNAEAFRTLCEMAKDMQWSDGTMGKTKALARKLWIEIFEAKNEKA